MNALPTSQLVTTAHVQEGAPHISPQRRVSVCVILAMLSALWVLVPLDLSIHHETMHESLIKGRCPITVRKRLKESCYKPGEARENLLLGYCIKDGLC